MPIRLPIRRLTLLTLIACLAAHSARAADDSPSLSVAENNQITKISRGKSTPNATELVFEFKSLQLYDSDRHYGCLFVNGQIATLKQQNLSKGYIRAVVTLPTDNQLVVYCGVIKAPVKIDPHNHAELWKAFTSSPHQPFKADASDLPQWDDAAHEKNPATTLTPKPTFLSDYPTMLKPSEQVDAAQSLLSPALGDHDKSRTLRALSIVNYFPEGADALSQITLDPNSEPEWCISAANGLGRYQSDMPIESKKLLRQQFRKALAADLKQDPPRLRSGIIRTLINYDEADFVFETAADKLRGTPDELFLLSRLTSRTAALKRLDELLTETPLTNIPNWRTRREIAALMIARKEPRGIDITLECLTQSAEWTRTKSTPPLQGCNLATYQNNQHSTYRLLVYNFDENCGYDPNADYTDLIVNYIPKMAAWWKSNRDNWTFDRAFPTTEPKLKPGTPLLKQEARLLAARLAADSFIENNLKHENGSSVVRASLVPGTFEDIQLANGRWSLNVLVDDGPHALVTFAADGTSPTVTITYIADQASKNSIRR